MQWKLVEPESNSLKITGIKSSIGESVTGRKVHKSIIEWNWPDEVTSVYVYQSLLGEDLPASEIDFSDYPKHVYTIGQYKSHPFGCQREVNKGQSYIFKIFPIVQKGNEIHIINQEEMHENVIEFTPARAKIIVEISYKKRLFSDKKEVRFHVQSEIVPVEKGALCYVKKEDQMPISISDGTSYNFKEIRDYSQQEQSTIFKNELVNVFFSDNEKYGKMFELQKRFL